MPKFPRESAASRKGAAVLRQVVDDSEAHEADHDEELDSEAVAAGEAATINKHGVEVTESLLAAEELEQAAQKTLESSRETDGKPQFPALSAKQMAGGKSQSRRVPVPPHRLTPLRESWLKIFTPIVQHMHLQIRMNTRTRHVELRTSENTEDPGALQRSADFVKAFCLGFSVDDAIALLRLDNLYLDTFEVTDVKRLAGDHLARAIGRIAGKAGKTKFTIENATKTRIVLADSKIHILGEYQNIRMARNALANLIMGSPPGKVYGKLHTVAARVNERY
eukprot:m.251680 g.251680  ORF g.251680 m.251680 type:complete len:279 (-) comp19542_c0_seq3:77-913(-)